MSALKPRRLRARLTSLNLRQVRVTLREDRPPYVTLCTVDDDDPTSALCRALGISWVSFSGPSDEQALCVAALRGSELRLSVLGRQAHVVEMA